MDSAAFRISKVGRRAFLSPAVLLASVTLAFCQTETVIYTFQGQHGQDGYYPESSALVLDNAGNLYGTTTYGGGGPCLVGQYAGCGMIYQFGRPASAHGAWTENVL